MTGVTARTGICRVRPTEAGVTKPRRVTTRSSPTQRAVKPANRITRASRGSFRLDPRKPASVVFWMGVGVAQTLVWGVASLALMLIASPRRAETLDRAARGLGKVLWMEGLEPHFYGARELARLDRVSPSAA